MAQIALSKVEKKYPSGFHAVKSLDLTINDGQFLVLLGPSGCGKSTTLRMIAGLEDVTDGTIAIGDQVVNDVHPKDRDIAMVFQNYALYPHMSVYDNMAFALKLRKMSREQIRSRVSSVAEMLGLTTLLDRKPAALSGGQRQRVAVGRAIVREPKAFLFDEPLSNLDAKLRTSTRAELKALHARLKTTTVYVTHDQEEAMTLGDRIAVMSGGVLQQDGAPMEVYREPVNRFVAGFIGTPQMNFLEGTLQSSGDGVMFVEGGDDPARALRVQLTPEHTRVLRPHLGKSVSLGLRPQALEVAHAAASTSNTRPTIELRVKLVEPLGEQMDLTCASANHEHIVARVPSANISPGFSARFIVDTLRLHVFEPGEFGRNLTLDTLKSAPTVIRRL
jgi:multiple sugar transport system ATP-binding protein